MMTPSQCDDDDFPFVNILKPLNCKYYIGDSMVGEIYLNKMATFKTKIPQKALSSTSIGCAYTGGSLTAWLGSAPSLTFVTICPGRIFFKRHYNTLTAVLPRDLQQGNH